MNDTINSVETFDPAEYVQSGGWGRDGIAATAREGVSVEDMDRLDEMYGDDCVIAIRALESYCRERAARRDER